MQSVAPRYRVGPGDGDRTHTATGRRVVDALASLKKCVVGADVANAAFLAADLAASAQTPRLVGALVDLVADAGLFPRALALGVADDVAILAQLADALPLAEHANDVALRHHVIQAVVKLCLVCRREDREDDPRARAACRAATASLVQLRAEALPALQRAPAPGLVDKVRHALELLRTEQGEGARLRLVSLVARASPSSVAALRGLAEGPGPAQGAAPAAAVPSFRGATAYPHAATLLALHEIRPRALLLVAAFLGPAPVPPAAWTEPERKNLLYALMKTNVVFASLNDSSDRAGRGGEELGADLLTLLTRVRGARADPDIARGVDAAFRRRAKFDRLYGTVTRVPDEKNEGCSRPGHQPH